MIGFFQYMTKLVLNMTRFVINTTGFCEICVGIDPHYENYYYDDSKYDSDGFNGMAL